MEGRGMCLLAPQSQVGIKPVVKAMTDMEREERIEAALAAMVNADTKEQRRLYWAAAAQLINERSQPQIERMELERGLA